MEPLHREGNTGCMGRACDEGLLEPEIQQVKMNVSAGRLPGRGGCTAQMYTLPVT